MSNRKARWKAYRLKHGRAKLRLVAALASLKPVWTAPEAIELEGATAIIRRSYARYSPDHVMHRHEADYADDYRSEGARVLTWKPPAVAEPVMRMAA
jgi:hypothetical protein